MYSYTYGGKKGKKQTLKVAEDRIAVRTRNARKLRDAVQSKDGKEMLSHFDVEMNLPEADVSVLQAKDDVEDKLTMRDEARNVLKTEPELRFAGRVLMDDESNKPVLYTENLFLKFEDAVDTARCEEILAQYNLKIKQKPSFAKNSYFVGAPEGTGLEVFRLSEELLALPEVELCHPELVRERSSKTIHPKQWHLKKTLIGNKTIDAHANVEAAHTLSQGEGVIIAVIDDGVDIDHPEFSIPGKVVDGRDATFNTNDPRPKHWNENHGTACAGVACAAGIEASGVAPKAKLMPIRLASVLGSWQEAEAFQWAVDHGADVISCSWGPVDGDWSDPNDHGHTQEFPLPDSTRLAIENAVKNGRGGKGCVICWAAGNGRESVDNDGYASFDAVIAVAACNDRGLRSVYSDFGKAIWCTFPSGDFHFPPFEVPKPLTTGIYTTDRRAGHGYSGKDYADDFSGTSSATPGVAGIAALMLAANPALTAAQVKNLLRDACEKIDKKGGVYDSKGFSIYYGFGRPDAKKAVELAMTLKSVMPQPKVDIRIVQALVDPKGDDRNHETVTLKNAGDAPVDLLGWVLSDKQNRKETIGNFKIQPGATFALHLATIKLPNTTGALQLRKNDGSTAHSVRYEKKDINLDGVVLFN